MMVVTVEAVDGFTRIKLQDRTSEVIEDGIRLEPGQTRTFRVEPEVILQVGNARAPLTSRSTAWTYGAMGKKPEATTWLIRQGEQPRAIS